MARNRKSGGDLIENRPIYKNAKAMIGLVTALAGAVVGVRTFLAPKQPEVVHDATEIIIDRSRRMGDPWEGTTRMAVAVNAADLILKTIAAGENLALREFGGPCERARGSLDVPFAENNADKVKGRIVGLRPNGQATLYGAINEAIGDFGRQKYFEGSYRRILVITGSDDACGNSYLLDAIGGKLEEHAKSYNIRLDVHFLGVGLEQSQKENLKSLLRVTGGTPSFADRPDDVARLVRDWFKPPQAAAAPDTTTADHPGPASEKAEKASVRQQTGSLEDSLKAGVKDLDEALKALASGDSAAAEAALTEARRAGDRADAALSSLEQPRDRAEFQELYEAASKCRKLHRQLLSKAQVMVAQFQAKNADGLAASRAEYDRLVDEFDRAAKQINALLAKL